MDKKTILVIDDPPSNLILLNLEKAVARPEPSGNLALAR